MGKILKYDCVREHDAKDAWFIRENGESLNALLVAKLLNDLTSEIERLKEALIDMLKINDYTSAERATQIRNTANNLIKAAQPQKESKK